MPPYIFDEPCSTITHHPKQLDWMSKQHQHIVMSTTPYALHCWFQLEWVSGKVNSGQEAYPKWFAVHILKFEILHITLKKFQFFTNKSSILMFFCFVNVVCKISNFNMWTAKRLMQASCTEFTLTCFTSVSTISSQM